MIFEVRHVGFVNKGSELMLLAILQQMRKWDESHIVSADLKTGSFSQRSQSGLFNLLWADYKRAPKFNTILSRISRNIPSGIRQRYNLVLTSEVETIFDASGFSYSDQWGTTFISDLLEYTLKRYFEGKKTIFLPQAFGPFNIPQNKKNMKKVIEYSDLIFARDQISYDHLINLDGDSSKIKISPDFTNLVQGRVLEDFDHSCKQACIVPNARMVDKNSSLNQDKYLKFLHKFGKYLIQQDYEVVILVHEESDSILAEQLLSRLELPSRLKIENNPLIIKGLLGQSSIVIGSRYHAIVSSLSQGIPTIGTSWSHKYEALFKDYNCRECLITNIEEEIDMETKLRPLMVEPDRSKLIKQINFAAQKQRRLTENMWEEIYQYLFLLN